MRVRSLERNLSYEKQNKGGEKVNGEKGKPLIEVTFVILGESITKKLNPNRKLKGAVQEVLAKTGNTGQPFSKWQIRTEDGRRLDMDNSFEEEDITSETKLFLSIKADIGG